MHPVFIEHRIQPREPQIRTDIRELRFGYDGEDAVTADLGDSYEIEDFSGWSPWGAFRYTMPDGSVLLCSFEHGLLVALDQLPPER
jgi:hypothetical protein